MEKIVGVVGLGYVGLPLATAFGSIFKTIGFDISAQRVEALQQGVDKTFEVDVEDLRRAKHLILTSDATLLKKADFIVIAVPTPVDIAHQPDFTPLISASRLVAPNLKKKAIVVYESTVYPGATEEVCIPILEKYSGKKWKKDFFVGYSPERVNPGDKLHTLKKIVKVVSGDCQRTLDQVACFYGAVIEAGIHRVSSIKVAEAAKVIENTQRDLNIALMNELAIIFHRVHIDTLEVLEAAGTKWNFLSFRPGLVGGHCIGVDPYYLTHKAEKEGYHTQVILAGRRINDGMGEFIAEQTVKKMLSLGIPVAKATVNILGLTFKENCPDIRNSKVMNIIRALKQYHVNICVHDPVADYQEVRREYALDLCAWNKLPRADAVIIAVAHRYYIQKSARDFRVTMKKNACLIDVKSIFQPKDLKRENMAYWRL